MILIISSIFLGVVKPTKSQTEVYLAGGCLQGAEYFLKRIRGIESTQVGYANSTVANPNYEQVCSGKTNAAGIVKVIYDPEEINLSLLLNLYSQTIDSTSLNRRGDGHGTRYGTGTRCINKADLSTIDQVIQALATQYNKSIAVEVEPLANFYPAEVYHQDYLDKNPGRYCHINLALFEMARKANAPKTATYQELDNATLHKKLSAEQYAMTQKNVTESAFHSELWNKHRPGIYIDITTGEPLFIFTDKFDSGCGWPSFSKPVQRKLIVEKKNTIHGMIRTEVRSKTGGTHSGHVFTDRSENKGGLRHYINSAPLRFTPKEKTKKGGYGEYPPLIKQNNLVNSAGLRQIQ